LPSDDGILWPLIFQFILIFINAIFACAEISVISLKDSKLEKLASSGDKRAIRLTKLTEQPSRFFATIQVGITLAGFLGSAFAADNFSDRLANWLVDIGVNISINTLDKISVIFITLLLSYFTLILGELVPKRIAMRKAEQISLAMSGLIYFISKLFAPIVWLLTASTNALLKLIGIDPHASDDTITEEEIRMMVDKGSENGAINSEEKQLIQNVFEFDDKTAEDVMTHRTDVVMLWLDDSEEQWEETIYNNKHTYYPVCDKSTDDIIGILKVRDYLMLKDKSREKVIQKAIRPAYFVPETVRADLLFRNMKTTRNHFAIVLDEYGGMVGIVTMNDLLEQIVGDFVDDDSPEVEEKMIEQIDSNTWNVHGSASLEDISKELGILLPYEDYETLGGLVFGLMGYIPDDGSTPEINEFGLSIKVTEIKDHQLERAIVTLVEKREKEVKLK